MANSTERVKAMRARKSGRVEVLFEPDDVRTILAIREALERAGNPADIPASAILLRGLHAYLRSLMVPE